MNTNRISISLGLRARLILGFTAITFLLFLTVLITITKVHKTNNITEDFIETQLPVYEELTALHKEIFVAQATLRGWILTRDQNLKVAFKNSWEKIDASIQTIDNPSKQWMKAGDLKAWQEIKETLAQLKNAQMKTQQTETIKEATTLLQNENLPLSNKILDLLDGPILGNGHRNGGMFSRQSEKFHNGSFTIISDLNSLVTIEYILLAVGIFLAIIITNYTVNATITQVSRFRKYANKIAAGDLTDRLTTTQNNDELNQLGNDLNLMTDGLAKITREITTAAHSMVTTLDEVRHAIEAQSSGAIEQAASVNEITASLEEIEKSSTQTKEKTRALGNAAEHTREKGQLGLDAVEQSIKGMNLVREKVLFIATTILELSNKTQQVGEITAVVNNLAQQSKMLALNASIEAAKAGEAGKGFSVVAAEVKNLAEQSEHSITQVQKILEDIRSATEKAVMATEEGTKGVDQGTELVEQTGDIVRKLTEVIHETTIASQQIEAAIGQETIGIAQITTGMGEINQVTATFVESVHQTTEAIEHLASIAKQLKQQIDVYKI